jgi:ATP-binding cassette, subfamily A (ABC1), member 3
VYTLRGDGGNVYVNVKDQKSDLETKVLPLQWALDSVSLKHEGNNLKRSLIQEFQTFLATRTGSSPHTPQEWPFTQESNAEQAESNRQCKPHDPDPLLCHVDLADMKGVCQCT